MLAHECVPNSGHFENMDDGTLEVVSLVDIPKNAPITMCYDWCLRVSKGPDYQRIPSGLVFSKQMLSLRAVLLFKGTDVRRRQLLKSKYFYCSCARCKDPYEFNTNFSSILCSNSDCKNGYVVSTKCDGLANIDADWKCRKCSKL